MYSTDKVRSWVAEAGTKEARKDMILSAVPVVTAWRTAQAKAEGAGFTFKPIREKPHNADHTASETEMRAIRHFRNHPDAKEYSFVDEEANAVGYFRPVRLGEVCRNCHGDLNALRRFGADRMARTSPATPWRRWPTPPRR
ncbi:Tll0287-like domain-containing protein [Thiohalorhabdus sp.]|uniref:Tll0287-like domain-containing protein n=1 Tax=Thiohalorhabdus sp. TaxID=3094134 RepID=UPI002FC27971